jgi:hypothetical protein
MAWFLAINRGSVMVYFQRADSLPLVAMDGLNVTA